MRLKGRPAAVIILILVIITLIPVSSIADNSTGKLRLTAEFYLVAVTSGNKEKGVLVPVTITITPGNGTIRVSAGGEVGATTLESTIVGVKLASLLAGVDWRKWNYNVSFHTDSGIDGPSGSMMITLVTYTLLSASPRGTGYDWFIATGAISPDGLASSVGAVNVKCGAVLENGKKFYYPLVNETQILLSKCKGTPYTGLLNLTSYIYGVPEPTSIKPPIILPGSFNETMITAASRMSNMSLALLDKAKSRGISNDTIKPIYKLVNESLNLRREHSYASASLAFTALMRSYQAYYTSIALQEDYKTAKKELDAVSENVSKSIVDLERRLDSMPRNGSIYYLEFLATAYTRIATAKSSLLAYEKYSTSHEGLLRDAIPELAHATARIVSIEEWIKCANASRNENPRLTSSEVEKLAYILKDYSTSVESYAKALAEYVVKYYGRSKSILVYIDILDNLESNAENYMNTGNYLAAIGFYREALSQSLRMMFQASLEAYHGPGDVRPAYARELEVFYSVLASRLLSKGYTLGLAPAYYDYARVLGDMGDEDGLVQILDEAVVSETVWVLSSLTYIPSNATSRLVTPSPSPGRGVQYPIGDLVIVLISVGVVAFIIGYSASIRYLSKLASGYSY